MRVGRETRREHQCRERIATEGGREREKEEQYIPGCKANGARVGEIERRNDRGVRGCERGRIGGSRWKGGKGVAPRRTDGARGRRREGGHGGFKCRRVSTSLWDRTQDSPTLSASLSRIEARRPSTSSVLSLSTSLPRSSSALSLFLSFPLSNGAT